MLLLNRPIWLINVDKTWIIYLICLFRCKSDCAASSSVWGGSSPELLLASVFYKYRLASVSGDRKEFWQILLPLQKAFSNRPDCGHSKCSCMNIRRGWPSRKWNIKNYQIFMFLKHFIYFYPFLSSPIFSWIMRTNRRPPFDESWTGG